MVSIRTVAGLMGVLALYLSAPAASAQQTFSLRATNDNLDWYYVRNRNNKIALATINPNKALEIESATFLVVPALNGKSGEFSIESFHNRESICDTRTYRLVLSDGSNP